MSDIIARENKFVLVLLSPYLEGQVDPSLGSLSQTALRRDPSEEP